MANMKAGTHVRDYIPAAGRPHFLWWQVGWGEKVTIHNVAYIRRTPPGAGADYGPVGQPGYPDLKSFDADRPGPVEFAADVAVIAVEYSCPVDSEAFCA